MSQQRVSLVYILCVIGLIHGLAISCTTVVTNLYMKSLGSTILLIAVSNALFFVPRGILHFISGKLSDRVGSSLIIVLSLAFFTVDALVYFLSLTPLQITFGRVLQGIAGGLFWAPIYSEVSRVTKEASQAKGIAWFTFSQSIGTMLGSNLGGYLAQSYTPPAAAASGLILFGFTTILAYSILRRRTVTTEELRVNMLQTWGNIGDEFGSIVAFCIIASTMISLFSWGGVLTGVGMNLHVNALGGDYALIGNVAALSTLVSLGFTLLTQRIMAYLKPSVALFVTMLLTALITLAIAISKSLTLDFVLFPAITAVTTVQKVIWIYLIQEVAGKTNVGRGIGLYFTILDAFTIGYFLLFGFIVEYRDLESMFLVAAVISVVLAFLTKLFLDRVAAYNQR